jgi:hypothetical protein
MSHFLTTAPMFESPNWETSVHFFGVLFGIKAV